MLLCIDLGGTAVKLGLVDAQGHIHQRTEANVRSDGDATPILTAAMAAAKDFLTGTGVTWRESALAPRARWTAARVWSLAPMEPFRTTKA